MLFFLRLFSFFPQVNRPNQILSEHRTVKAEILPGFNSSGAVITKVCCSLQEFIRITVWMVFALHCLPFMMKISHNFDFIH
jgi:hypothetical protein